MVKFLCGIIIVLTRGLLIIWSSPWVCPRVGVVSCLELCKTLSWAAFVSVDKETTYLLTYLLRRPGLVGLYQSTGGERRHSTVECISSWNVIVHPSHVSKQTQATTGDGVHDGELLTDSCIRDVVVPLYLGNASLTAVMKSFKYTPIVACSVHVNAPYRSHHTGNDTRPVYGQLCL